MASDVIAQATVEGVSLSIEDGYLACEPPATGALRDVLREHKAEVLALLGSLSPVEADAIRDGWTRKPDGSWEFPAGWSALYPRTPEGFDIDWDGIETVRTASRVALPADEQPRPGLRPLTPAEQAQIRAGGALPAGVSYGQTATGQWRRLT